MGDLNFRVLGPVEVIRNGRVVPLGRGTLRDLLAALIVSPNQIVSAETLTETVWCARPPAHPRATLQSAIARLRRMIGGDRIETLPSGYRFRAEAADLDLLAFERLLRTADQERTAEDALAALTEAVGLWRGAPLENVVSPALLNSAAPRLTQLYLNACEKWASLCLRTGGHDAVVARLTPLVEAHPFREGMIEQLMLALYRGGRQADAIAAYEALRRSLSEDMGIDPSPPLRDLHLKILRADPALDDEQHKAGRAPRPAPGSVQPDPIRSPPPAVVPRQLPRDLPDFCGREADMKRLTDLLIRTDSVPGETPVVVISGKGGIGKTALAIQAAHRLSAAFCDGQLLANLRGGGPRPAPAASVLASFLRALGVTGSAVPRSIEDRIAMFRSLTADRRLLIVLDNAAGERQVRSLLPASASCAVIITSRTRMAGLAGTRVINLDVLDDGHAVDLLGTIIGPERVAAEPNEARLLVSLCGGLPLALRIVGVRLAAKAHWPLATLIGRLNDQRRRLNELTYGDLDVRATFALSYEALDEPAKAMLRRLSLLDAPDFPAWAGAALLDIGPGEAADICERLVDAQLLDPVARQQGDGIRYEFHDLVRAFAEELAYAAESDAARTAALDRAFGAWLALAEQAHRQVYGGDYTVLHGSAPRWRRADADQQQAIRRDPVTWLERERLALLAAVRQSAETDRHEVSWDLAWTAVTLYEARGYYDDWSMVAEHALSAARAAGDARGTAAMLISLVSLGVHSGRIDTETHGLAEQALRMFTELGDVHGCALARYRVGIVILRMGDTEGAIPAFEQGTRDAHQVGDAFIEAGILRELASVHLERGDYEAATSCLTKSLRLHETTGSLRGRALTLYTLGELRLRQGDPNAAKAIFQQVLDMIQTTSDLVGQAFTGVRLAEAMAGSGLRDQAEERLLATLRLAQRIRNRTVEARALLALDRLRATAPRTHIASGQGHHDVDGRTVPFPLTQPAAPSDCSQQIAGSRG
ncbi:MAG: tetratricopeptide repeat protein [Streptosporangiaceae bacterium]|nr:tetratricopeptide repeat protein [Streptosporangiaceae bacterium]MBV9853087.1 tetratricopeptide repeat protein [Streptosporangiaceae bacterium]